MRGRLHAPRIVLRQKLHVRRRRAAGGAWMRCSNMDDRKHKWMHVGDVHTMPVADLVDHDQTRDCWCSPTYHTPCPENCKDGCWRCGHDEDGMLTVTKDFDSSVQVIHRAADGRE